MLNLGSECCNAAILLLWVPRVDCYNDINRSIGCGDTSSPFTVLITWLLELWISLVITTCSRISDAYQTVISWYSVASGAINAPNVCTRISTSMFRARCILLTYLWNYFAQSTLYVWISLIPYYNIWIFCGKSVMCVDRTKCSWHTERSIGTIKNCFNAHRLLMMFLVHLPVQMCSNGVVS